MNSAFSQQCYSELKTCFYTHNLKQFSENMRITVSLMNSKTTLATETHNKL